jgi:predicted alpha/beta-fold hydrolase
MEFRPLPLLGNPHVQTLLGNLLPASPLRWPTRRLCVCLPDGDRLVLHESTPRGWQPGGRVAMLVHGLGGSHQSGPVVRTGARLLQVGMRVVRVDLRGAGSGLLLARRTYHGGCSDDLRVAVEEIRRRSPGSPVTLIGFSLGGNIVLKLAGESAADPLPGLDRVAALAPPVDFERCSSLLSLPQNRLYERHFLRGLLGQIRRRRRALPEEPDIPFPRKLTLRRFDDLYTAPRSGFRDAAHYYCEASCLPIVPMICVPTLILAARDDPFIAVDPLEQLAAPANVRICLLPRGGHLGFLGWGPEGVVRWAEERIVDWVCQPQPSAH